MNTTQEPVAIVTGASSGIGLGITQALPNVITALAKFHPLGRIGELSDLVDAVLYLQNPMYETSENIRVDREVHAGRQ